VPQCAGWSRLTQQARSGLREKHGPTRASCGRTRGAVRARHEPRARLRVDLQLYALVELALAPPTRPALLTRQASLMLAAPVWRTCLSDWSSAATSSSASSPQGRRTLRPARARPDTGQIPVRYCVRVVGREYSAPCRGGAERAPLDTQQRARLHTRTHRLGWRSGRAVTKPWACSYIYTLDTPSRRTLAHSAPAQRRASVEPARTPHGPGSKLRNTLRHIPVGNYTDPSCSRPRRPRSRSAACLVHVRASQRVSRAARSTHRRGICPRTCSGL